jgi:hypothetical protein
MVYDKDNVWQNCVWKIVCKKMVCERWCVKDGLWRCVKNSVCQRYCEF